MKIKIKDTVSFMLSTRRNPLLVTCSAPRLNRDNAEANRLLTGF